MTNINVINLRAAGSAAIASVVVVSSVAAPVAEHRALPGVHAVSVATTQLLSVNWEVFDHVVSQHAQSAAASVAVPAAGTGSSTAPKVLAVPPTTRSAAAQPAGVVTAIESAIVSTLSNAFILVAKPLVSNPALAPIFGPFVFAGMIFFGLFVGVPIVTFNSIFAPILNLLPFAAVSAASTPKSASPKATLPTLAGLQSIGPKSTGHRSGQPGKPVAAVAGVDKGAGKARVPASHTSKISHKGTAGHGVRGDS